MKKNVKRFLFVLLPILMVGCAAVYDGDDLTVKKKEVVPPGPTYTKESEKCLNVVYYVPADTTEWADWHYRLSGVALHVQKYFEQNLKRYKVNRKFGLELNDVNPEFVKIHYVKSTLPSVQMIKKNIGMMEAEVLSYFEKNPGEKNSDNFLVFMPKYNGSFLGYTLSEKGGMAFCGCDDLNLDISYFESPRGRIKYLTCLPEILYNVALSFGALQDCHGKNAPYFSLLGTSGGNTPSGGLYYWNYVYKNYIGEIKSTKYIFGTPDKVRLSEANARYLEVSPLFWNKDQSQIVPLHVEIVDVEIASLPGKRVGAEEFFTDTVFVKCRFKSDVEVSGVVIYNDPWTARHPITMARDKEYDQLSTFDSGNDAYCLYKDKYKFRQEGDEHVVEFEVPMSEVLKYKSVNDGSTNATPVEFRFRFIGSGGGLCPAYPGIKGVEIVERILDASGNKILDVDYGFRYLYEIIGSETSTSTNISHDIQNRYGIKEIAY